MSSRRIQAMAKLIDDIDRTTNDYDKHFGFYQIVEAIKEKIKVYRRDFQSIKPKEPKP